MRTYAKCVYERGGEGNVFLRARIIVDCNHQPTHEQNTEVIIDHGNLMLLSGN